VSRTDLRQPSRDGLVRDGALLEVPCRRCERRGRLSIARLIAEHGREDDGDLRL
jgi:hypothetical protein